MVSTACVVVLAVLAVTTNAQSAEPTSASPCPNIFTYEQRGTEKGKWYGVINLTTDITLHSLWLNVVLDSKADILGNWVGEVSTKDNIDFKVENTDMKISPGSPISVRFFVQYNPMNKIPTLKSIRLNGKEICNIEITRRQKPEVALVIPESLKKAGNKTDKNSYDLISNPKKVSTQTVQRAQNIQKSASNGTVQTYFAPTKVSYDSNTIGKADGINRWVDSQRDSVKSDVSKLANTGTQERQGDLNTKTDQNRFDTSSRNNKPDNTRYDTILSQTSTQNSGGEFIYERPERVKPTNTRNNFNQYTTTADRFQVTASTKTNSSSGLLNTDADDEFDYQDKDDGEDYAAGIPTIFIPSNLDKSSTKEFQCGKVVYNSQQALGENGVVSLEGQYPWQVALYQNQRSGDNKYICGGTLVTHRHVITAAHCVTRRNSRKRVNQNTLTLYLGKSNLRTSVDGVQIRFVEKIIVHPDYNTTTLNRDLAVLQLKEAVSYTDHVLPVCLWPESLVDLSSVVGKHGTLVGWGSESSGATKQELTLVRMPVVDYDTCAKSYSAFFAGILSVYTYCASYAEGTSVCNGDSGGGMVFKNEDTWYLRGVASLAVTRENQYRCDPHHYVIFTDIAKFLPWIKNNVYDF